MIPPVSDPILIINYIYIFMCRLLDLEGVDLPTSAPEVPPPPPRPTDTGAIRHFTEERPIFDSFRSTKFSSPANHPVPSSFANITVLSTRAVDPT